MQESYCPPLDSALFYAVLSDLNPNDKSSIDQIRTILDSLKLSAEQEQKENQKNFVDFDPSGASGTSRNDESVASTSLDNLSVTDDSHPTDSTDSSGHTFDPPESYDEGIEELSYQEKADLLLELCPNATLFDIQFTLKKYNCSFRRTLDETLNLEWIKENHTFSKGVDGFFHQTTQSRKHKGKNKSKNKDVPEVEGPNEALSTPNAWQIKDNQIKFIASRVQLSESLVRSEYHKAGGSQRTAILNLCKVDVSGISGVEVDDSIVQVNAAELGEEFPGLSSTECLALIMLTHPFTARAHELAKAVFSTRLNDKLTSANSSLFVPQYARPQVPTDNSAGVQQNKSFNVGDLDQKTLSQVASNHAQIREEMFSKANVAWRKSRSNRLMGGAAAYYSEESRKANATSRAYSSAAADARVLDTNTGSSIDLHGVNVQDAVRNAKLAVQRWWDSGQAEWAKEGKVAGSSGFAIITGAGTHSQGGRAKIRPAVIKMLKAEGWRVDDSLDRAQVIVLGRSRVR